MENLSLGQARRTQIGSGGTYTETPVFIKGLTRVDEGSRHEGRMLNAQNPSAMSPTNLQLESMLRIDDYDL
jgi:hypothetical protein